MQKLSTIKINLLLFIIFIVFLHVKDKLYSHYNATITTMRKNKLFEYKELQCTFIDIFQNEPWLLFYCASAYFKKVLYTKNS